MTVLSRHALVWPSSAPSADGGDAVQPEIDAWHRSGRPFVVATRRHGGAGVLSLGMCLPRRDARAHPGRVGAHIGDGAVVRMADPPSVADVAAVSSGLDRARRRGIELVATSARGSGLEVRVFGSWMWFWVTGEGDDAYVSAGSDLDVLVRVGSEMSARTACELLESCESQSGVLIDGELSVDGVGEVHWREVASGADPVLVKGLDGPQLVGREGLWQ